MCSFSINVSHCSAHGWQMALRYYSSWLNIPRVVQFCCETMVCSRVIENNGEPLFALYYCRANSRFVIMAQFSRGRTSRTTRPTPGSSSEDFWEFRNTFFSFPSWICWITGFQHLPGDIHECLTTRMTELCRCLWYFSWLSFRDHVFCISSHGDLENH